MYYQFNKFNLIFFMRIFIILIDGWLVFLYFKVLPFVLEYFWNFWYSLKFIYANEDFTAAMFTLSELTGFLIILCLFLLMIFFGFIRQFNLFVIVYFCYCIWNIFNLFGFTIDSFFVLFFGFLLNALICCLIAIIFSDFSSFLYQFFLILLVYILINWYIDFLFKNVIFNYFDLLKYNLLFADNVSKAFNEVLIDFFKISADSTMFDIEKKYDFFNIIIDFFKKWLLKKK